MNKKTVRYVYTHTRRDNGIVFYVGKGEKNENGKTLYRQYKRAYTNHNENRWWAEIKQETEIDVKIVYHSKKLIPVYDKEAQLIKKHGRIREAVGWGLNMKYIKGRRGATLVNLYACGHQKIRNPLNEKQFLFLLECMVARLFKDMTVRFSRRFVNFTWGLNEKRRIKACKDIVERLKKELRINAVRQF